MTTPPGPAGLNASDIDDNAEEAHGARAVALDIVQAVLEKNHMLDPVLDKNQAFHDLSPRDRSFARMLVATTLRRLGQIDDIIQKASNRPGPPSPPRLNNLLRLGAAQILFMNVPDYAVVDTTVGLVEQAGMLRQKGFANALLRQIARQGQGWLAKQDEVRLNMPVWLYKQWIADYGADTAEEIGRACLAEAALDLTVKNPEDAPKWAEALDATLLPNGSLRRSEGGKVTGFPGFEEGAWWVQDLAASLPARLLGDISGHTVVDLCAAPGGKTAQLASQGAYVIALDRSARRLQRLESNIKRLALTAQVEPLAADAGVWQPEAPVSYILLDAPCTATGTIRRHPDVLHQKGPEDMARLAALQARLLENSAQMLAPGGVLVYCTCSLQKEEGERQIDKFLERHPAFSRQPIRAEEVGGLHQVIDEKGDLRCLPFHLAAQGGMDGFYAARLVKAG